MTMKIGINGRFLLKPFTGIGQHTINLIKELAKIDAKNQYVFFVAGEVPAKIAELFPKNVEIRVLREKKLPSAGAKKVWWEQIQLPKILTEEKFDIAYFPYPINPWTKDFYKNGPKIVVTVHDCLPWKYKHYTGGVLSRMAHEQAKKATSKADIILTVSQVSKKEISDICEIDPKKISVIHNDAGDVFKKPSDPILTNEILGKYGLQMERFFFYCGGYDERKNVPKLINEYADFVKDFEEEIPLVLAGGKAMNNSLYRSFDEAKSDFGEIIKTGFLKEEELKALYENCMAFVNLSREEGFNIPILEAANCGSPLIISDTEIHKEIAGENAEFVDISKSGTCTKAMGKMLDHDYRGEFSEKSKDLAKKYSWKISAQKVYDVLFS
ncbi:MAG: glycosyltransferase family 1 protein [Candidatus Gracilibacteria bacterium]|jgi:glycosyltransferase involved in cell wall biosynthesis